MTKEEIKNKISEYKECCKKLAEEYRQRYNEDNTDKLALNMFYHNVISFNDFEIILAAIEDRNSMMMCFSEPPYLTEETVEVNIKRIAELEKENAELQKEIRCECTRCVYSDSPCIRSDYGVENDEDVCPNYENVFTAYTQLKEEIAVLRKEWQEQVQKATDEGYARTLQTIQLTKAKELLERLLITSCNSDVLNLLPNCSEVLRVRVEAEQFINNEGCPNCFCEDCTKEDCNIRKLGLVSNKEMKEND